MRGVSEEFAGPEEDRRGSVRVKEYKSVRVKAAGDRWLGGKTRGVRSFAPKARSDDGSWRGREKR